MPEIPPRAISIAFLQPGKHEDFKDGVIHRKTAPCTIIAQTLRGRYEVRSGGKTAVAEEGEAFLATDGQPLEIVHHARRRGELMSARWLHARFLLHTTVDFVSLLALPPKIDRTYGRAFGEIIGELLDAPAAEPSLALAARRYELGYRALRLLCEVSQPSAAGQAFLSQADRLAPVLSFVREHLARPLSIDDLADAAHLSRSRFHAYFRQHMRVSPMDYVKRVRLTEARQLLLATDQPIYAIAEATGFSSAYHFSREFKRFAGAPPVDFRRQNSAMQV